MPAINGTKMLLVPFAAELEISPEELEEILMKRLDMSSLEAINPRFESSKLKMYQRKNTFRSKTMLALRCNEHPHRRGIREY